MTTTLKDIFLRKDTSVHVVDDIPTYAEWVREIETQWRGNSFSIRLEQGSVATQDRVWSVWLNTRKQDSGRFAESDCGWVEINPYRDVLDRYMSTSLS